MEITTDVEAISFINHIYTRKLPAETNFGKYIGPLGFRGSRILAPTEIRHNLWHIRKDGRWTQRQYNPAP